MEFIKDIVKLGGKTAAISFGVWYGLFLAAAISPNIKKDKDKEKEK